MERLQKILAHAGIASRRKCEELIVAGRVRVNGKIVFELGTKVDPTRDKIEVDGKPIRFEKPTYIVLHKPKGYLSDVDESSGKKLAVELVTSRERLYAAGRLDLNSEGLLLLTNDGDLAHRITHPRFRHEKEYLALVTGTPTEETLARLRRGISVDSVMMRVDAVRVKRRLGELGRQHGWSDARPDESWLRLVLHEGRKREIRILCNAIGHPVKRLIRTRIGNVELGALPVGKWRALSETEVRDLRNQLRIQEA